MSKMIYFNDTHYDGFFLLWGTLKIAKKANFQAEFLKTLAFGANGYLG